MVEVAPSTPSIDEADFVNTINEQFQFFA